MLNELVVKVSAKIDEFNKGMNEMQKKLEDVTQNMKETGESLTTYLTLPMALVGGASIKLASDMQESLNKVNVAFGSSAQDVLDWSKTSVESLGMASGSALDAAALFGDMATSMGISQKEASLMAMSLTQLGADLASFKNIPIEQAMQALNGVFTGETESLKLLGVVMTQTQLQAFALTKGITKKVEKMTEAEMVSLRYAFVLDRTKNAQGDFARTSEGSANQMRIFTETLKEIGIQLGNILLPIFTSFIQKVNGLLKEFIALPDSMKTVIVVIGAVAAAIGPLLLAIGSIAPVIGTAITAIKSLFTILRASAMSFALFTNPVFLTIAAIGALVAAGVYLYKNWDAVKQKFEEMRIILVNGIKYVWEKFKFYIAIINPLLFGIIEGAKLIVQNWEIVKTSVSAYLDVLKTKFEEKFGFIITNVQKFLTVIGEFGSKVGDAIGEQVQGVVNSFGQVWEDSGIKAELALSREKYALEQRIKAINENAGKTDYMTSRSLIMTGQMEIETNVLKNNVKTAEQLAEEKRKAAEAAKLAAEKAKELAKQQEAVRKSAIDAADALGNALVTALEKKRRAEQDAIKSAKDLLSENDKAYQDMLETIKDTENEAVKKINDTNKEIVDSINERYDKIRDANNEFYSDQISENQRTIDAISRQTQTDEQEELDRKYKNAFEALTADKTLQADRKNMLEKFSSLILNREEQALKDGRTLRIDYVESLTEEENKLIRNRIFQQRGIFISGIQEQNKQLKDEQDRVNKRNEDNRTEELNRQSQHYNNLKNQLTIKSEERRAEAYRQYLLDQMALDANIREMEQSYDAFYKALNDKAKTYELLTMPKNQKALIDLIKTYNPEWYLQGQSLGESLINGLDSKKADIEKAITDILKKVEDAKKIQIPTLSTPKQETKSTPTKKKSLGFMDNLTTTFGMFANGGIVTAPTLSLVGEGASPEAIIPLNRINDFIGQNQTHIYLDGREITRAVAPSMVDTIRSKVGLAY